MSISILDGVQFTVGGAAASRFRSRGLEQETIHSIARMSNFNVVLQSRHLADGGMDCRALCQKCNASQKVNYDDVTNGSLVELGIFCSKHRHDGKEDEPPVGRQFRLEEY